MHLINVYAKFVKIYDMRVSISYFEQVLRKRKSQTRQAFNLTGIYFCDFVVLKLFACTKFLIKNRE